MISNTKMITIIDLESPAWKTNLINYRKNNFYKNKKVIE